MHFPNLLINRHNALNLCSVIFLDLTLPSRIRLISVGFRRNKKITIYEKVISGKVWLKSPRSLGN